MGAYLWDKKKLTKDYDDIDVFWLKKHGYFCGYKEGGIKWTDPWGTENTVGIKVKIWLHESYVEFTYDQIEAGKRSSYSYRVRLVSTTCYFGGRRYWFICPLVINGLNCGRRVGKLFIAGHYFGCRHCYRLAYASQNEPKTGYKSFLIKFLDTESKLSLLESKNRQKFRKGIPTKPYKKILSLRKTFYKNTGDLNKKLESITKSS